MLDLAFYEIASNRFMLFIIAETTARTRTTRTKTTITRTTHTQTNKKTSTRAKPITWT